MGQKHTHAAGRARRSAHGSAPKSRRSPTMITPSASSSSGDAGRETTGPMQRLAEQLSAAMSDGGLQPALGLAATGGASHTSLTSSSPTSMPDSSTDSATDTADLETPDVIEPDAPWQLDVSPRNAVLDRFAFWGQNALAWVRGLSFESWVWIAILVLATVLRFWDLGAKPLHHDESMHAFFSLDFARDPSSYWYDPLLHGPFQFHAEGLIFAVIIALSTIFHVATAAGNPWINDATARILPAATGVAIVALTYGLRRPLGRIGAPVAALLLAISPAFVYFSRFLREDIYFACFTYATVICAVQFSYKRSLRWFIATAVSFVLAYATMEAIYLNLVIWISFLVLMLTWEAGYWIARAMPSTFTERERAFFGHAAPLLLLGAIGSAVAGLGLHKLNQLSAYINAHTNITDVQVKQLENTTVSVLLYASILLALVVIAVLVKQIYFDLDPSRQAEAESAGEGQLAFAVSGQQALDSGAQLTGSHAHAYTHDHEHDDHEHLESDAPPAPRHEWFTLDPDRQPLMHLLRGISWVTWFVAFVVAWVVFSLLYWIVPGSHAATIAQGFQIGIGRGIWQGLYYWLQQQQVARGGQPWYYYLILIPLYEQFAVVFGIAGIVVSLRRPTRFRLFLIYWFLASLALYSWAGEKMPWLSIHILLPLELLAAVAIEGLILQVVSLVQSYRAGELHLWSGVPALGETFGLTVQEAGNGLRGLLPRARVLGVALGVLAGVAVLIPTLHGMYELAYVEPANGPHEMMIYVQTTPDVDLVMSKINRADQLMYGGRHQLKIAVGTGEEWPFYWYLRDYYLDPHPSYYATFDPNISDPNLANEDVLLLTTDDAATFLAAHKNFTSHEYSLRSWWDEGYKPPPCVATTKNPCPASSDWGSGVGVGMWLSYGDVYPPHAKFDLGRAATRVWDWLWNRTALGYTNGSYDFVLVVRNGVPIQP